MFNCFNRIPCYLILIFAISLTGCNQGSNSQQPIDGEGGDIGEDGNKVGDSDQVGDDGFDELDIDLGDGEFFDGDHNNDDYGTTTDSDEVTSCINEIGNLSDEIYSTTQGCTAIVRIDTVFREIVGYQIICGPYSATTEEDARAAGHACSGEMLNPQSPEDEYVFCYIDSQRVCGYAVSTETGLLVFEGWAIWWEGEITHPTNWRPSSELGADCNHGVTLSNVEGYDLFLCGSLSSDDVDTAINVVSNTALPAAFTSRGFLRSAVVLYYPKEIDTAIPLPSEWIVLLNGGP